MDPVASSSSLVPSGAAEPTKAKPARPRPAPPRIAASRFLSAPSAKSGSLTPRKAGPKRSLLIKKPDPQASHDWVDSTLSVDVKGKGRATDAPSGGYTVPSRFMSALTSSKGSSSAPTRPAKSTAPPSTTAASRPGLLKSRPPPPSAAPRPTKPRSFPPSSILPPLPPSPSQSIRSTSTSASRATATSRVTSSSRPPSRSTARSGTQSSKEGSIAKSPAVPPVPEEQPEPSKALSWLDLARSLGTISIPPPANSSPLHTHAQYLFLLLGHLKLTSALDASTAGIEAILTEAKESLAKAEEDVREEVERERLGQEITLLEFLLDPKIGHRLVPLLFELYQARQTYDTLLAQISSDSPPSHHHSLLTIKALIKVYAQSLSTLSNLPCTPSTPLADVVAQMLAQSQDKLAVLRKVTEVVEARRDEQRRRVWEESRRRGDDL